MFIYIPLLIVFISIVGSAVIISRKVSYLRKLTPESHELSSSFWHDMFPEAFDVASKIQIREHWTRWLSELEKALRQTRVWFSRLDRWWADLINRVKTAKEDSMPEETSTPSVMISEPSVEPSVRIISKKPKLSPDKLKGEEQKLIIGIAQDPKNSGLYESLGDVYIQMGNFSDAIDSFKAAVELKPEDEKLKKKLSQVEAVQSKFEQVK